MLTSLKLIKECPLSQFKDLPDKLDYFKANDDCFNLYQDGLFLWKQHKYFLFFMSIGSIFEYILFEMAQTYSIELYRTAGRENDLPRNEAWITSSRKDDDNFTKMIKELENRDRTYIKDGSFYKRQLWSEYQALRYVIENTVDSTVYKTLLLHLNKIKQARNSFTHGNLQSFYKKIYPNHRLKLYSLNLESSQGYKEVTPFIKESPNQIIIQHMFGHDREDLREYLKKDFTDVYLQTAHILDYVMGAINSNHEELPFMLPKKLP